MMPRFIREMMTRVHAEAGDGADLGAGQPSAELLKELDMTVEEFAELPERERLNLLIDTSASDDLTGADLQEIVKDGGTAVPAPSPAPAPGPTPAPPAPTPSPAPGAPAPAPAPGAPAPAPTPAPTPAPEPKEDWKAVPMPEPVVDVTPEEEAVRPPTLQFTAAMKTKQADLQKQLDDIEDKFAEGHLTKEEMQAQRDPLRKELRDIDKKEAADAATITLFQTTLEGRFTTWVAQAFKASKAEGGIDYEDPANEAKLQELDAHIKRFAAAAPLMHPQKSPAWRDKWALNMGLAEVDRAHGIKRTGAAAPAPAPAPGAPAPGPRPPPDLSKIPPSLRTAPAAGDATIAGSEFGYLESLSIAEREKAIAAMDSATMDRYLS